MDFDDEPRAKTEAEVRDDFIGACQMAVNTWATDDRAGDVRDRLDGLLHSFLRIIDGVSGSFHGLLHSLLRIIDGVSGSFPCALDLVASPHPSDKAFHQDEGENWIGPGTIINGSDMLHDLLHPDPRNVISPGNTWIPVESDPDSPVMYGNTVINNGRETEPMLIWRVWRDAYLDAHVL